ncbi:MAG: hypothetical protein ACRD3W_22230, partial [Terriglobales bacterium]
MPDNLVTDLFERETRSLPLHPRDLPGMKGWTRRRHIVDTKDLTIEEIDCIMFVAGVCKRVHDNTVTPLTVLQNKIVANLFYEDSTRTRS